MNKIIQWSGIVMTLMLVHLPVSAWACAPCKWILGSSTVDQGRSPMGQLMFGLVVPGLVIAGYCFFYYCERSSTPDSASSETGPDLSFRTNS